MVFSSQRREMVVFLITNIWPTWRHVQMSGKNVCVFVCVCGGGGGETDSEGEENGRGVRAVHARENIVNKVNGLVSCCLHTIVLYTETI